MSEHRPLSQQSQLPEIHAVHRRPPGSGDLPTYHDPNAIDPVLYRRNHRSKGDWNAQLGGDWRDLFDGKKAGLAATLIPRSFHCRHA